MSEMGLVAPPKQIRVTFSLDPAYNGLCSLYLLNADLSGFGEWVSRTTASLSPEELKTNEWASSHAGSCLRETSWSSFGAWVDDLAERDPVALRDRELDDLVSKTTEVLGLEDPPSREKLLSDRALYVSLVQRLYEHKGTDCDCGMVETDHRLLQDPSARLERIVSHLRAMWNKYLAEEWERNLPALRESIAAFESLGYADRTAPEIVHLVTGREMPREWDGLPEHTEELVFVPSVHIGPYLSVMHTDEKTARIVFGARVPRDVVVRSAALSRSELVMRLNALADDTRLRILELVAREGEQRAQDIIAALELSQSATSRHLRQLSATGYLAERRCEGAKCYHLSRDRIEDTFAALQEFLH